MEEGKALPSTSVGGGGRDSLRPPSSFVKVGDRQMFTVELQPGETTIVSWKKLMKDANKARGTNSVPGLPAANRPSLEARVAPEGKPEEDEVQDAAHPKRFSAVIEKIERLYMGKDSSDEEDLLDAPDDDQYDTEDSFIDDAELDEYFEVDNSAIKHDGFFVNRGKLESLNENQELPIHQPKKRRRKEPVKHNRENGDGHGSNKHLKTSNPDSSKTLSLSVKNSFNASQIVATPSEGSGEPKSQDRLIISEICSRKKSTEAKDTIDPSAFMKAPNGASVFEVEVKNAVRQQAGVLHSKNVSEKSRDISGSLNVFHQKYHEKSSSKSQSGRPSNKVNGLEKPNISKVMNVKYELPDLNLTDGKSIIQATKSLYPQKKDSSSVRPKSSMLEKAIRELEKMVAESRPPSGENQEADTAQAVKRRLPREIKLKLAKVARLAQASHGKVSKELINRLMSILGHLIQLRTLKRNLKVMISMGLSAKQETNVRFQQVKEEVVEMIKMQAPSLASMGIQQQTGIFDDFQEFGSDQRASTKRKFNMDAALEDKICELYDHFVDGLDEDVAPQVRKLYAELAQLWPNNTMDNHGIKRAIVRAKERRGAMHRRHKDHVEIKRKKMLIPGQEGPVRVEPSSVGQQQYMRDKLTPEFGYHGFPSVNKPASNVTTTGVRVSESSIVTVNNDRVKQEKEEGQSGNYGYSGGFIDGTLMKKKVKRKPELDMGRSHLHPQKLPSQEEERPKPLKHSAAPVKSNLQLPPPSGVVELPS